MGKYAIADDGLAADLSVRLRDAGAAYEPGALIDLIDGVNASPLDDSDNSWIALFDVTLDDSIQAGLKMLRADRRKRTTATSEDDAAARLTALRKVLKQCGVDGLILPRADEHQGEFLPRRAERLAWLTGFDGSNGVAIILADKAVVFTDGRYTLQIRQQVDDSLYEIRHITEEPPAAWIADILGIGQKLAYDPWLHTSDSVKNLQDAVDKAGASLVALDENPIDGLWQTRPPAPLTPVVPHDARYAGVSASEKRLRIAETITKDGHDVVVLSSPESIAWLFNIRGRDVPCTPLPLSFAILDRDANATLFVDERKLGRVTREHLGNAVTIRPPTELGPAIDAHVVAERTIRIDPSSAPVWIRGRIQTAGGVAIDGVDPVAIPRACKNSVELAGARAAHERDGAAYARFLHWFTTVAPSGTVNEMTAAGRLRAFRAEEPLFKGLSFETISGAGPNGAIVHYRTSPETNRTIRPDELYLIDSGAQYLDGTTDITRTIAVGDPGGEARDRFTRVLKGHIAISTARFPAGSPGSRLDSLARAPLWQAGLDFDHGTGHGVGSYLGVHEGPQNISWRGTAPLEPGMIISNEPGYYKEGSYGIRIENLLIVIEQTIPGGERSMLGFEVLSLAPIDRSMIELSLLTGVELKWLNDYHANVYATLAPMLEDDVSAWLAHATAELG